MKPVIFPYCGRGDEHGKNKGNKRKKEPTLQDLLKYEIARPGSVGKGGSEGWGGLTTQETGRLGE
jgi:hypothetical protein